MKDSQSKAKESSKKPDALQYAYKLLSYRDRSEKELAERLRKKGFQDEAVANTIRCLKSKGFINEESLARSLKRIAEEVKLLGDKGVRTLLQQRGISREIIEDIIADNPSDEVVRVKKFVDRKLKTMENYSGEKIKKRIWGALMRKGYSFETIREVFKQLKVKEEE
ncbi:MAG: regulatory protein RecX [Nitrospirae bacterium]|nr:regulatory protein RecX [Nitrospirota bacterium]